MGGSVCTSRTFWFVDQSSPIFSPNVEGVVVDQVFFTCWICGSVPEIFAISCQKCRRNWTFFGPPKLMGGGHSKSCTRVITPPSRYVVWKSFVRELPLAAKLKGRTLRILDQILNFRDYFWGTSVPVRVCASKA